MAPALAIVGMACRYPDAASPEALWENVLAQRRAFRRIPSERLNESDYRSADREAPDRTYTAQAAVLEGYEFDRVGFRVSGRTFRSADLAHWLALDVTAQALDDAGFGEGRGLPRETTGVFLGNTLTGEFSRANGLRLRWPYVRRVLDLALAEEGWDAARRRAFLEPLEARYKAPFPPVGSETLAGGLSNTIAGRICNHFDLKGGGYTVDGACASSLLAVIHACSALSEGDLDVALAGGVDLSLDPFELVGFAKVGALASDMMRVYDARSDGFWPGEGCGVVVLMRHEDALAQGLSPYAIIRGWGVSSDGSGGITRPEVEGQLLAVRRAYRRAGFGIGSVALFEGHGTGTSIGDATELRTLSVARRDAAPDAPPAALGSVKANIGHTKAAAGAAGLLKATLALHYQILPPTTGCETPHPELAGDGLALRVLDEGEPWPTDRPLRAGVSAMGFGGINGHVVLESPVAVRRSALSGRERTLLTSHQDVELFVLGAEDAAGLQQQVTHLLTYAARLSLAELADLAAQLADGLKSRALRAALVASSPAELAARLETLAAWLAADNTQRLGVGVYLGDSGPPCIGFLFPGQGSPAYLDGGAWGRRFVAVRSRYEESALPARIVCAETEVAQPAIVTASVAALRVLEDLGVGAAVALGHSLGELTALHWAGALDEHALLRLVAVRGQAMAALGSPTGAMASLEAGPSEAEALIEGQPAVIAGLNGPLQTVVSGEREAVASVVAKARARGLIARPLRVSHAFHSALVAAAAAPLSKHLAEEDLRPLQRTVGSTVTGGPLEPDEDLRALLCRQLTAPVRFTEAVTAVGRGVDLWIEVGPGRVVAGLMAGWVETPVVATDAGGSSLRGLLQAVGAAFALGAPVRVAALFEDRFRRPFSLDWQPRFLANPCEKYSPPDPETCPPSTKAEGFGTNGSAPTRAGVSAPAESHVPTSALDQVRRIVAERAELPLSSVRDDDRLLSDLHLNSIVVGELAAEASRRLGRPPPLSPTAFADATIRELAAALDDRSHVGEAAGSVETALLPAGVDTWVRPFTVDLVECVRPRLQPAGPSGPWHVIAPPGHPLLAHLQAAIGRAGLGEGVAVVLPPDPTERYIGLLLEGARAAMARPGSRFVLVQHGGGAASFARTLHLEAPDHTTCVVDVPIDHPDAVAWVVAEAAAASGYAEAHYDASGTRREPRLRPVSLENRDVLPLGPDDVLLVTGGAKGITAECALGLGQETGARLVLLGRSQPDAVPEVADTLGRMLDAGIRFRYLVADVTDAGAVRAAVEEAEAHLGPVTGVLHGAARNVPQPLGALDEAAFGRTLAPKVQGLGNVLAATDPEHLRLLVTFGSIIARTGLAGEADYAIANEWLVRATERWQQEHPQCRCLAVEWSVWEEVGMGPRLGRIDGLLRQGITPIPTGEGVAILKRLLAQRDLPSVVVAGRTGALPTLGFEESALPFRRFLEQPRVYYPGIELVVEALLSTENDPYLDDHVLRGDRLLPAVLGLEAMAQAAMAVAGRSDVPVFEHVAFDRPVAVPVGESVTIRIAALVRAAGPVDVALRCETTGFQTDHFRATCRFDDPGNLQPLFPEQTRDAEPIALDPERDLYGGVLFHRGRFQRLRGYRLLRATACVAEIGEGAGLPWFGRVLPTDLALGDPGARDAAIHAVQACIPHATLVPIGIDRLVIGTGRPEGGRFVQARERSRTGDTFVYDLAVTDADGRIREQWEGLRLQLVDRIANNEPWAAPLLGPYLERRLREVLPGASVSVALVQGRTGRRDRSDRAIRQALGSDAPLQRRLNGKPEAADGPAVSAAHADTLTVAVAGAGPLACDVEPVTPRSKKVWGDLLGPERWALTELIAKETEEDLDTAATRVWTALECLKKAGAATGAPLMLETTDVDGWSLLASGPLVASTLVTTVRETEHPLALTVLAHRALATVFDGEVHHAE